MSHSLHRQVQVVGRRARALLIVHALSWFVGTALLTGLLLGLADFAVRYRDPGLRLISSVTFAAIAAVGFFRFIWPALNRRFDDVEVAQQIERRYPQLGDRLSSAVAFLRGQRIEETSSVGLRQAVIAETESLSRGLNLTTCLDSRVATQSLLLVIPLLLLIGTFCAVDRESAGRVTRRLLVPWGDEEWPRWNALQFVSAPRSIAAGDDFEVQLIDRHGHLPDDAVVQYWFAGDAEDEIESRPLQQREGMLWHRRENVLHSFRYRAVGGDDDSMTWRELEVVPPVRVESLVIWLQPPAYAKIVNSQSSGGPIRVLAGTSLSINGRADRPLSAATLCIEIGERVLSQRATFGSSSQEFELKDIVADTVGTGQYWLELVDEEGLVSRHEARAAWEVVVDQPPSVLLLNPAAEAAYLPTARVPLHIEARDDLELRRVELRHGDQVVTLFEQTADTPLRPTIPTTAARHEVTYQWELGALGLQPADVVDFELVAFDSKAQPSAPQLGSLRIVTEEDFDRWLQRQQELLAQRLAESLRIQTTARGQVESIAIQLGESSALPLSDVDLLQAAEMQQRQVERLLVSDATGARQLAADLVAGLHDNRIDRPDVLRRGADVISVLTLIQDEQLPTLTGALVRALKVARLDPADKESLLPALQEVISRQQAVQSLLEQLVGQFIAWEDFRHHIRGFASLLREQQDLTRRTNELPTLGKALEELSVDERARLQRLAQEQGELARRFERDFAALEALRQHLVESNPSVAATLGKAADKVRAAQLGQRMQDAQASLSQNQLGQATRAQQETIAQLNALLDVLNERNASTAAQQLKELQGRVQALAERQTALNEETRVASENASATERPSVAQKLTTDQQELADDVRETLQTNEVPPAFAMSLSSVEQLMRRARDQLAQTEFGARTQQLQTEVRQRLQAMLTAFAAQSNRDPSAAANAESQTAPHNSASPPSSTALPSLAELRLVREMQLHIQKRTEDLEILRQPDGQLDPTNSAELEQLAAEQQELAELLLSWIPSTSDQNGETKKSQDSSERELDRALEKAGVPGF